jgi:hypothetical protein
MGTASFLFFEIEISQCLHLAVPRERTVLAVPCLRDEECLITELDLAGIEYDSGQKTDIFTKVLRLFGEIYAIM